LEWSLSTDSAGNLVAGRDDFDTTLWVTDASGKAHSIPSVKGEGFDGIVWVDDRIVTSNIV
jgi:hypothetical protein